MATESDVRELALSLPQTEERSSCGTSSASPPSSATSSPSFSPTRGVRAPKRLADSLDA
jgi:hypothetical protein